MAKVGAYRCRASELLYPADYVKKWGTVYGIGLGPVPVSESLQTDYQSTTGFVPGLGEMHAVGVSHSEMDYVEVEQAEFDANAAILDKDDPGYHKRMKIIRPKQLANSLNKIRERGEV